MQKELTLQKKLHDLLGAGNLWVRQFQTFIQCLSCDP